MLVDVRQHVVGQPGRIRRNHASRALAVCVLLTCSGCHRENLVESMLKYGGSPPRDKVESPAARKQEPDNDTALFYAAKENNAERAGMLIADGANVNARAGVNYGPMHPSPYANLTPLHIAARYDSRDVARVLIERGADPNAKDLSGATPLHLAVTLRDPSFAALLLDHRAGVDVRDGSGNTPLMKAASQSGGTDVVELLINRGANVNARNNSGETALYYAACSDESRTVSLLLAHGADANARANDGETALDCTTRIKSPAISTMLRAHGAKP